MQRIADAYGSDALTAHARQARASVQLADGDAPGAARSAREAWEFWQEIDAPYEAAQTRSILGRAYRALGDDDAGLLQLRAARTTFRDLGSVPIPYDTRSSTGRSRVGPTVPAFRSGIVASTQLVEASSTKAWDSLVRWPTRPSARTSAYGGERSTTRVTGSSALPGTSRRPRLPVASSAPFPTTARARLPPHVRSASTRPLPPGDGRLRGTGCTSRTDRGPRRGAELSCERGSVDATRDLERVRSLSRAYSAPTTSSRSLALRPCEAGRSRKSP